MSAEDATSYNYTALDRSRQCIRLLHIKSRADPTTSMPCYELVAVSLIDSPDYDTISYCWGDPTPNTKVVIGDQTVYVPTTSAAVLTRMSRLGREYKIWIDAICINQKDTSERSHQVTMMRQIYSQGRRNFIFLGQGDAATLAGLQNLKDISQEWLDLEEMPRHGLKTHIDEDAIIAFSSLPWFTRVWVVQEATLAKDSIILLGNDSIELERVMIAIECFAQIPGMLMGPKFQTLSGLMSMGSIAAFKLMTREQKPLEFKDTIPISLSLRCTDMRDYVYGVLGLISNTNTGSADALLEVDYTKPYQHVIRDAIRYVIKNMRPSECADLNGLPMILRLVYHQNQADIESSSLPSWVPHFERGGGVGHELEDHAMSIHAAISIPDDYIWYRSSADGGILELSGRLLGKITRVSPAFELDDFADPAHLRNITATVQAMLPDGSSVISRLLLADTNCALQPSTEEDRAGFQSMMQMLQENKPIPRLAARDLNAPENVALTAATYYHEAYFQACSNRRLIITDAGEIGLASRLSQVGDSVVVLRADCGGTPYVLRGSDPGQPFKLVGVCYLDGYMPGQEQQVGISGRQGTDEFFSIA